MYMVHKLHKGDCIKAPVTFLLVVTCCCAINVGTYALHVVQSEVEIQLVKRHFANHAICDDSALCERRHVAIVH